MKATLKRIAAAHGIETLRTQSHDALDFHDIAVWTLEEMLTQAFEAGQNACPECTDHKEKLRKQLRKAS